MLFPHVVLAADAPALAHDADLYLVPIGPVPASVMRQLAERYREVARLKVETTAELPLPDGAVNKERGQLIAEKTHELMMRIFEPWKWKAQALVVAVSAYDMYIADTSWRYAFAYGEGKYALVSAKNMADAESTPARWSAQVIGRLSKMLDKRVAVQYFGYGAGVPAPEVLSTPILGLDDLDRLDASLLDAALQSAASGLPRDQPAPPSPAPLSGDDTSPLPYWAWVLIAGLAVSLVIWLAMLAYRKSRSSTNRLSRYAEARGWRYVEEPTRWYQSTRGSSMEGEIDGVPFRLDWFQTGSGKSARMKTRWACATGSDISLSIVPSPGLWGKFRARNRTKTGDTQYDCRFIAQGAPEHVPMIPNTLRALHLGMPVTVLMDEGILEVIHDGPAGVAETDNLIRVAMAWLGFARSPMSAANVGSASTDASMWDVLACALSQIAGLAFWLMIGATLLLFFAVSSEESNRPWEIALYRVMPVALLVWLGWLAWRWGTRFNPAGRVAETIISVPVLGFFWLMSGPWVLAWNTFVGEQREVLAIGSVLDREIHRGKHNSVSYSVTLRDIEEQRPVEVLTDQATYERVRPGDPVGFELTRGSLGIYYRARWR